MSKINQRLANSNALREYKKTITLNAMQRQVIVGTLLGDASIPLQRGKPTLHVEFQQTIAPYIWIYGIYTKFFQTLLAHRRESRRFVAVVPVIGNRCGFELIGTRSSNLMTTFGLRPPLLRYPEGGRKKRVAENIGELLRAVAYWDDGASYTKNQKRYYVLNTQSFPLEDQEKLIKALSHNFGIHATIQKQRFHDI